jgi:hypothetical protein
MGGIQYGLRDGRVVLIASGLLAMMISICKTRRRRA